jgi:hypothetical protein
MYNLINKLFIFYLVVFELNTDDIDDINEREYINNINNYELEYSNEMILSNMPRNYNHYNYYRNNIKNHLIIQELRQLLLFYLTYLFTICKIKNNNFESYSNINFINYDKYDNYIKTKINNLNFYHQFNINSNQFKLNHIEANIINCILKTYNNGYLNIYNYNYLIKKFEDIQQNSYQIIYYLNQDSIIFKLIHYINNLLILISILSLNIYYINFIPDFGILYILIISFIYLFINNIIYILLNNIKFINVDNIKNQGINIDNILQNSYDELYILSNIIITEIEF